jgi:hypothetical protein
MTDVAAKNQFDVLRHPKVIKAMRDLCPDGKGGVTTVTLSGRGRSVTLTHKTRQKCDRLLKQAKGEPVTQEAQTAVDETGPAAAKLASIRNKAKELVKAENYVDECKDAAKAAREERDALVRELLELIEGAPLFDATSDYDGDE